MLEATFDGKQICFKNDFLKVGICSKHAQWRIKSHDLQFTIQAHEQNVRQILSQIEPAQKRPNNFSIESLLVESKDELNDSMPTLSPKT